jgi:hypothetical protein
MARYIDIPRIDGFTVTLGDGSIVPADGLAPQTDDLRGWVYLPVVGSDLDDSWWDGGDYTPDEAPPFLRFNA